MKSILVSGNETAEAPEVSAMTAWLLERGVAKKDILTDDGGSRTLETMNRAAGVFDVHDAVICTQDVTVARSLYLAEHAGINAVAAAVPSQLDNPSPTCAARSSRPRSRSSNRSSPEAATAARRLGYHRRRRSGVSPSTDSNGWVARWLDDNLVCPYDGSPLTAADKRVCAAGHDFPVVHGVPVVLRHDVPPTHHLWRTTADDITRHAARPLFDVGAGGSAIDPFVERWLVATCGLLYRRYRRPLARYPIPDIALPPGEGRVLLDVGSNWGRWALAAARAGYRVVAIDPWLEAALAGTRIARQLDIPVAYVVGDARHCRSGSTRSTSVFRIRCCSTWTRASSATRSPKFGASSGATAPSRSRWPMCSARAVSSTTRASCSARSSTPSVGAS